MSYEGINTEVRAVLPNATDPMVATPLKKLHCSIKNSAFQNRVTIREGQKKSNFYKLTAR